VKTATRMLPAAATRARRYAMAFAIQYRQGNRWRWQRGVTRNISASGVLFDEGMSDRQLMIETPIDMQLILPSETVGHAAMRVFCVTRVVDSASFHQTQRRRKHRPVSAGAR